MNPSLQLGAFVLCCVLWGCGGDGSEGSAADACASYCAKLDECGFSQISGPCLSTCESQAQTAASISGACAAAAEAEGRCIGALSCERLEDWADEVPDAPCQDEDAASNAACNP